MNTGKQSTHTGTGSKEGGLRTRGNIKRSSPQKPLITVITVVKNSGRVIEETIKSVLAQAYDNLEYIVIDGASSDDTLDIIKKYDDSIDYWLSQEDRGVYEGMNKGIALAGGEWINFMNAGDRFYRPDVIQLVVEAESEDVDFIYGDHIYGDRPGPTRAADFEALWQRLKKGDFDAHWLGGFPCHQSLFARARVLKKFGYDTRYRWAAEQNFLLTAYAYHHRCLRLDTVISIYSKNGLSYQNQVRSLIERWWIYKKFRHSLKMDLFFIDRILGVFKRRMSDFLK